MKELFGQINQPRKSNDRANYGGDSELQLYFPVADAFAAITGHRAIFWAMTAMRLCRLAMAAATREFSAASVRNDPPPASALMNPQTGPLRAHGDLDRRQTHGFAPLNVTWVDILGCVSWHKRSYAPSLRWPLRDYNRRKNKEECDVA